MILRSSDSVNIDVIQIEFEFEIFDHRKKSLVGDICNLRAYEVQMLDEGVSRPRRPIGITLTA